MQLSLREFGKVLRGIEDLKQRAKIILETPKGSVPHNPEFGSEIYKYLDKPLNLAKPFIIAEALKALRRWEPELEVKEVSVRELSEGKFSFEIRGIYKGEEVSLEVLGN